MADAENLVVDWSVAKDWTPYEGLGKTDHIKAGDGLFAGVVTKYSLGVSDGEKTKGEPQIAIAIDITDDDAKGAHTVVNRMLGGKDKNGEPLLRQFFEFLYSVGFTKEVINTQVAAWGKQTLGKSIEALQLVGRPCYMDIATEYYKGEPGSKVQNFRTKDEYTKAVQANTHRRPHRPAPQFSGPPAGFTPQPGAAPGGLALPGVPAAPTAPVIPNGVGSDPLSAIKGLPLPARS